MARATAGVTHPEGPSGRLLLRLGPALHRTLRRAAAEAELSLNEYCCRKLAAAVGEPTGRPGAQLVQRALQIHGAALLGVLVFGSWARGEAGPESDLDLLVVLSASEPLTRGLYRSWDESPVRFEAHSVEPHLVHLPRKGEAGSVWAEAALDAVVLFERDLLVSRQLAALRHEIAEGRLVRRVLHGQPYWVKVA